MDFIREKIKEKPISKRKLFLKIGVAVLCGLVFSLTVLVMMLLFGPLVQKQEGLSTEGTEFMETEQETSNLTETEMENTEEIEPVIVIPPDLSLSITDYQTLQDELYEIGNKANKSIVTVAAMADKSDEWAENPFETEGQSSGVIVSEDDNYLYILTEKKVISDTSDIRVSFVNNTSATATLLKWDGNTGLAILTVEKRQLSSGTKREIVVASLGSSYEMTNGAIVIALGSPLGTNYSILTGNITSVQNKIATRDKNYSVFTTDIVASENASGVLINTKGEVVGIVMQSFSGSQDMSTLTAVVIDELQVLIETLCNRKDIPYMGIYISTVTKEISKEYDIPVGIYIKEVASESPAVQAGLQSGDVIVKMNGEEVTTDEAVSEKISQFIPGTTCEVMVKRQNGDEYYDVTCTVEIGVLE
ncbi:MAG: serine protease [Agathobacter sp.]|nr:serine protease [Agathobacter sp.]